MKRVTNTIALTLALAAPLRGQAEPTQIERGQAVYQKWCSTCHGPGQHTPGTMALAVKYQGKLPPLLEQRADLNSTVLQLFIRNGISVMPTFRQTEISDQDIEAIAAYLKHSAQQAAKAPL